VKALDLAITVSYLGPAILMRGELQLWGVVMALLTLHALALSQWPLRPHGRQVPWPLLVMLFLLPLEILCLRLLLAKLGLATPLPLVESTLTLWVHAGAFHVLLGRQSGSLKEHRRLGVQTACYLPLALMVPALAGQAERWLCGLGPSGASRLLGQGWGRLMLAILFLILWRRWQEHHGGEGNHAGL
jgi:hypothetical protein